MFVLSCPIVAWCQTGIESKLSISSQMFIKDYVNANDNGFARSKAVHSSATKVTKRMYATPETIDGCDYISCFLRLKDLDEVKELDELGVQIQCRFNKGLVTALVPVDNFLKVAELANVSRVNVATLMTPTTHKTRELTNVDDILTCSPDAIAAGISSGKTYDGTGVLLGIIDTGIDFSHIAFRDKDGNSRIKGAYCVKNWDEEYLFEDNGTNTLDLAVFTTDNNTQDHGTHTASTAGGSSVIVDDSRVNVMVTDDHANATYGGMAPGASLYLAGLNNLWDTYTSNAIYHIVNYAENNNLPLVVSNSWGSQFGPHDGTGNIADVYNYLFGDDHPNRVALFAASNDGGKCHAGETGGYHVRGTATATQPLGTIVRSDYTNDGGEYYDNILVNAWARSTYVERLDVTLYILDASTGEVVDSFAFISPSKETWTITYTDFFEDAYPPSGRGQVEGTLNVFFDYLSSDKTQVMIYAPYGFQRRTYDASDTEHYGKPYTLAVELRPSGDTSTEIDMWGGNECYFTTDLAGNYPPGHTWTAGSDDMCVSDEATIESVISVGAYVGGKDFVNYLGEYRYYRFEVGDIAYFSSYATVAESPTGLRYPWITAPGTAMTAGVNHYHTADIHDSYYGYSGLMVDSETSPYGIMNGTSMATPTAAGIVTLWMQAANERGWALNTTNVKNIMKSTAITDSFTISGPNATHFGNGKIDALAGIAAIIERSNDPVNLTLNDDSDNSSVISQNNGYPANVTLSGRTLYKDGDWNTLCLPFDLTATQIAAGPLAGADIRTLNSASYSNGTLSFDFTKVDDIEAGVPYIVKWPASNENIFNPVFNGVTISSALNPIYSGDAQVGVGLCGTYDYIQFNTETRNILFLGANNTLYYPGTGAHIGPQRAVFELNGIWVGESPQQAPVRSFATNLEEDITAIRNERLEMRSDSDFYYDLQGRKLNGKPSTRGIYINNGRKVIVQ
ncbi:MAG: S8 family serine peptidase [Bacteroidaceae bacterium]|nr:S8 family serine peptidase [Bacteroidaceae bacterium]